MTPEQITALAREYAEEMIKGKPSEELPPGTLVVLCQSRMGEDNAIALCVYIKNRFMIYDRTFKYDKEFYPTHWMPIPSLPETNTEKRYI